MVQLHAEYYGRGPTKAKTYITGDLVAVVLEETFTRAERTLMDHGDVDAIQTIRRRFQQRMEVRAFLSETSMDADVAVEIFLLAGERTDMEAFEEASGSEAD
jgi:hypothetical protein